MATFSIALSGLTAANSALDITSNNIANAEHHRLQELAGRVRRPCSPRARSISTPRPRGEGVQLIGSPQQFTQGDITTTSSPLDMAISGNGFFTLDGPNGYVYTRNGAIPGGPERQRGERHRAVLQVYPPLANGGFNTGALQNLNLNTAQSAPVATTHRQR